MALVWLWPRLQRRLKNISGNLTPARPGDTPSAAAPLITVAAAPPVDPEASGSLGELLKGLFTDIDAEVNTSASARELESHPKFIVARRLLADPTVPIEAVRDYAVGPNWFYSCAGLAALCDRDDRDEALDTVTAFFDNLTPWGLHFGLSYLDAAYPRPPVGVPLLSARDYWRDNMFVITAFREYLEKRADLGDAPDFGAGLEAATPEARETIKAVLARINHPLAAQLIETLESARLTNIDRDFLTSFGRFWHLGTGDVLIEPEFWTEALVESETNVLGPHPRALLASGESRVGKTAFLKLLGRRLAKHGWTVFEASGADLMAGQQWFGQLEARIQRAIEELAASKKIIWYIPDILQVALSGTHQGQAASILDQILPAVSAGRLVVWTEASAAGTSRLMRLRPALRATFEIARLEPMEPDETEPVARAVARELAAATGVTITAAVAVALASARQYLTSSSAPGAALDLLKLSVKRVAKGRDAAIDPEDIIETLSQLTGLPASILDSHQRVDLSTVRSSPRASSAKTKRSAPSSIASPC